MDDKIFNLLEKMYLELQEVRTDVSGLKAEVKQNSNHILRLEDKVENKFGALFDTRDITNEKLDNIDAKVDDISRSVVNIELITSKNWNDIAILKKAK